MSAKKESYVRYLMWIAETFVLVLIVVLHENFPVEIIFYNLALDRIFETFPHDDQLLGRKMLLATRKFVRHMVFFRKADEQFTEYIFGELKVLIMH